jgi:HD-like signal output (HDOD) protein
MIYPELIEFEARTPEESARVSRAVQRIVRKLSNENLLAIDEAMQHDPQIIPKVLRIANNPLVKSLFNKM